MTYIGIDPGKKGGIAVMDENGISVIPYSDAALQRALRDCAFSETRCCLEQVHAMPKQGVSSTFSFGAAFGYIKGALEAWGISYQEIPPQRWKKEFGLGSDKTDSVTVVRKLFPGVSLRPTERSKTDNDGMAEALLMAEYAKRKL